MFGMPSIRIGRLFGIPLEVNPTWFVVFFLVVLSLSFGYFPEAFPDRSAAVNVVSGIVTALAFFASIVLHETSHSLVARAGGIRISRITLFVFGGVAQMDEEPRTPGREFVMAIAGPAMSMLISAVSWLAFTGLRAAGASDVWWAPIQYLAVINLSVGVFNLLPGFPLDGGRVLRSILWGATGDLLKATRWASSAGQFIGFSFVALAVLGVWRTGNLSYVWLGLIGWFLSSLAASAYHQQLVKSRFDKVPVSAAMSGPPVVAPGDIDLERMVDQYVFGERHSRYPVQVGGQIVGLVSLGQIKGVPKSRWPSTLVADIADRDLSRLLVSADAPLENAMQRLGPDGPGALLAVDDGRLVGIVTRADLAHAVQAAQQR